MAEDIHHLEKKLERCEKNYFSGDRFFEEDKKDLREFYSDMLAESLSAGRVTKCLSALSTLSKNLRKPFKEATEKDLKNLMRTVEKNGYSDWTKNDFKVIIRKYMRFLGKEETLSWLKTKPPKHGRLPQEILTEEEIKRLAETAYTTRDRAFVLSLYESGCRIGEFLPLKLKQVTFDRFGAVLFVKGKTGERRIRLVASSMALQRWIEEHPRKDDPGAYLWCKMPTNNNPKWKNRHLSYGFSCRLLRELTAKSGMKKKVNPHAFRHARATFMAGHLTEAQMKEYFGWARASNMAAVYVHLSGRDIDNAVLEVYGLKGAEDGQEPTVKVGKCPRCREKNDPGAMFCSRCGLPLKLRTHSIEKVEEVLIDFLKVIAEEFPKVKKGFRRVMREKGTEEFISLIV